MDGSVRRVENESDGWECEESGELERWMGV